MDNDDIRDFVDRTEGIIEFANNVTLFYNTLDVPAEEAVIFTQEFIRGILGKPYIPIEEVTEEDVDDEIRRRDRSGEGEVPG